VVSGAIQKANQIGAKNIVWRRRALPFRRMMAPYRLVLQQPKATRWLDPPSAVTPRIAVWLASK
jgi:hypothetical protein